MENEIKTRSIRADNESFEKFKVISEEFPNQAQALASLISVYEIEKSKAVIPERQAEIENFTAHIQKINELYNHSLLLNKDAEVRIRAEFERQLASKDTIIRDLQEKINMINQQERLDSEEKKNIIQENESSKNRIAELEKEIVVYQEEKHKNDTIIKSLTEIATEYKIQAKENEALKSSLTEQEKQIVEFSNLKEGFERQKEMAASALKQHTIEIERINQNRDKAIGDMEKKHSIEVENINRDHRKELKFVAEQTAFEKEKEILILKNMHTAAINELHADYQNRINELLKQREYAELIKLQNSHTENKQNTETVQEQK